MSPGLTLRHPIPTLTRHSLGHQCQLSGQCQAILTIYTCGPCHGCQISSDTPDIPDTRLLPDTPTPPLTLQHSDTPTPRHLSGPHTTLCTDNGERQSVSPIAEITLAAALSTTTLGVESSFLVLSTTLTVDQDNNVNTQTQLNPKTKSETMRLKSTNKNTPSLIRPHSVLTQACAQAPSIHPQSLSSDR